MGPPPFKVGGCFWGKVPKRWSNILLWERCSLTKMYWLQPAVTHIRTPETCTWENHSHCRQQQMFSRENVLCFTCKVSSTQASASWGQCCIRRCIEYYCRYIVLILVYAKVPQRCTFFRSEQVEPTLFCFVVLFCKIYYVCSLFDTAFQTLGLHVGSPCCWKMHATKCVYVCYKVFNWECACLEGCYCH